MSKDSMSQRKAAAYLGISPSTLSAYVRTGRALRHVNLHGVRHFEIVDLNDYLAARTVEGAQ
jgi:predicted transcriptional regulator